MTERIGPYTSGLLKDLFNELDEEDMLKVAGEHYNELLAEGLSEEQAAAMVDKAVRAYYDKNRRELHGAPGEGV